MSSISLSPPPRRTKVLKALRGSLLAFLGRSPWVIHSLLYSLKEEFACPLECSSCRGNFTVPANLTVSEVYFLVQAPAGLEFQVPTPLIGTQPFLTPLPFGINCALSLSTGTQDLQGTSVNGSLGAIFDSGTVIPLTGEFLGSWLFFTTRVVFAFFQTEGRFAATEPV